MNQIEALLTKISFVHLDPYIIYNPKIRNYHPIHD